jgi:hypothetical protein
MRKFVNKLIYFIQLFTTIFFFIFVVSSDAKDKSSDLYLKTMEMYEITFTHNKIFSNPYDPEVVEVNAYFGLPNGSVVCVPGFWYQGYTRNLTGGKEILTPNGNNVWKIRFTPRIIGKYEYYIEILDHASNITTRIPNTGTKHFIAESSNKKGFLKKSLSDSSYLEYDNGELFLGIGHNLCGWEWPGTYTDEAWNGTDNSEGTFEYDKWFKKFYDNNANFTQFDFCESDQIEWTNHPNEFPFSNDWQGLTHFNQQTAWKMDYRITEAENKNIYFRLTFLHWEDFDNEQNTSPRWGWARNPYNSVNQGPVNNVSQFFSNATAIKIFKKQVRYIVARWGYSKNLAAYELWNEVDMSNIVWGGGTFYSAANNISNWHDEIAQYIKSLDINKHLITTSFALSSNYAKIWDLANIDITTIHRYTHYNNSFGDEKYGTVDTINKLIKDRFSSIAKPVIIGEFALSPGGDIQRLKDKQGVAFHNQLWSSILSKGAVTAMHWNWGSYIHNFNLYYHYKPLSTFVLGEDFRNTTSFNNIGDVNSTIKYIGLKKADAVYLWVQDRNHTFKEILGGYTPVLISGQIITITNISNGNYTISFFNTYTGDNFCSNVFQVNNGILEILLPDFTNDLALKIIKN